MGIVTAKEVARVMNLDKLGPVGTSVGWLILRSTRLSRINKEYEKRRNLPGPEFISSVLKGFEIDYELPEKDLKRIPKTGPFITISNHPLGGIDGMILMKILLEQRKDYKVIANFLLHRLDPLKPFIMPVNPFEEHKDAKSSLSGIKQAIAHLKEGGGLGIFPAGEVSTHREERRIVDKPWEPGAMKLIQKANVPVIPIYFHAKNSPFFYRLAGLSGILRTAKLPSEMLSQKKRKIRVRIGNPISPEEQAEHTNLETFTAFLRRKTYMLANSFERKRLLNNLQKGLKLPKAPPREIAKQTSEKLIEAEIQTCRRLDKRLLESKNYEVFLAKREIIPNIVTELGRLREITFREVGEGSNKPLDLDKFDDFYYHMFLWDDEAKRIAGAYRMGMGSEIYKEYGIEGFYLQGLFRFEPKLHEMMSRSIEMGRAFIIKEYQQRPLPLFLLWKGIVHCTLRFPEHHYLIGGVTISDKFSNFSKSLMIQFMRSNFFDNEVAQYIRPKKEFKVKLKEEDKDLVFSGEADLNKFDKLIEELEPQSLRLPVLIKKYIKQNARVVAFNVDPLFNDAIDGLMYIKIDDLPESTVKPVMEEFQQELEQKAWTNRGKQR